MPQFPCVHSDDIDSKALSELIVMVSFVGVSTGMEEMTFVGSGELLCNLCRVWGDWAQEEIHSHSPPLLVSSAVSQVLSAGIELS